tara:strand:+ start:3686 stop:4402 length:717 start_codon:yes stop_codon:yes gene_type:complete
VFDGTTGKLLKNSTIYAPPNGNLGVGIDVSVGISGFKTLSIDGLNSAALDFYNDEVPAGMITGDSAGLRLEVGSARIISFETDNTERARFTSAGEVLIGSTSDAGAYQLQVTGKTYSTGGFIGGFTATTSVTSPLAWNSDSYSQYALTALANALTLNADAGTPVDGQKMTFRFEDNATPRVITFTGGASKAFRNIGTSLVVSGSNWTLTTVASKTYYIGCIYNAADSRWDIVSLASEA